MALSSPGSNRKILCGLIVFFICGRTYGLPVLQISHRNPIITTVGMDIKLSCTAMQWTDGFTITWSKNNTGEVLSKNLHVVSDPSRYAVTTVISSELESTTWTLTIKEAIQSDSGDYVCSLKTEPPQFVSTPVFVQVPVISDIPSEAVRWDVSECCGAQSVPSHCMPLCNTKMTGFDVLDALRVSDRCRQHHDQWFRCLASERDHTPCCKKRHVPEKCSALCLGNFSTVFQSGNLDCLHFVAVIFQCFHDGRESIPSPPRNVRVANLGIEALRVTWSPPLKHGKEVNYTVIYKALGKLDPGLKRAGGMIRTVTTAALGLILNNLSPGEAYKIHVVALNSAGSSQPSESAMIDVPMPLHLMAKMLEANLENQNHNQNRVSVKVNTTMSSAATLPVNRLTSKETGSDRLNDVNLQDDFVAFEKCFESEEFRSSCSPIFKDTRPAGRTNVVVRCRDSLPRFIQCAANQGDHRKCCGRNAIPSRCFDLCAGKPAGFFDVCHVFLPQILDCFKQGTMFLSGVPSNISAEFKDTQLVVQWSPPLTRPEMVENYIITIKDRKSGSLLNWTLPRDNHSLSIDPSLISPNGELFLQSENFHGLSGKSAPFAIDVSDVNEISSNFEQNIQPEVSSNTGPAVAIGVSIAGLVVVALVVGSAYYLRRRHNSPVSVGQKPEEKLKKPINAFYIPGYFGRRATQKTCSNSSGSYATSFSMRRSASGASEPVYSDVSGAYLWMFGNGKKSKREVCSRQSSEQNIYDNHVPAPKT